MCCQMISQLLYIYAQPVDTTLLCHRVTGWARSGAGPFRSPVLLRGTLPDRLREPTPSSDSFRGNDLKRRNYLRVIKHTKRSRDGSWFCAVWIHDWHWHWHWYIVVTWNSVADADESNCPSQTTDDDADDDDDGMSSGGSLELDRTAPDISRDFIPPSQRLLQPPRPGERARFNMPPDT